MPKKDAARRPLIEDSEIQRLLDACERQADPRKVALSRAVLSTLIFAGLRRSECLGLRVQDVSIEANSILVANGKGAKSRRVYPCRECLTALADWLVVREPCRHDYLFSYNRGQRMGHKALKVMLDNLAAIAGLAGNPAVKPHSLRHAAATRLARNGASLIAIQAFLGHTSVTTTSAYLHANEEMAREVASLGSLKSHDDPTTHARGVSPRALAKQNMHRDRWPRARPRRAGAG